MKMDPYASLNRRNETRPTAVTISAAEATKCGQTSLKDSGDFNGIVGRIHSPFFSAPFPFLLALFLFGLLASSSSFTFGLVLSGPLELLRSLSVGLTPLPGLPRYDRDPPADVEEA